MRQNIAGVGKTVIYDIENGKETVRLSTLMKILVALNISISLDSPLMDRYCTFPAVEKIKLFKLSIVNFLIGNEDMTDS